MQESQPLTPPLPHQANVSACAVSPTDKLFATAQEDGIVRVWVADAPDDHKITVGASDHRVSISPDSQYVAASGSFLRRCLFRTRVYSVSAGRPAGPVLDVGGLLNGFAFSSDGYHAVSLQFALRTLRSTKLWRSSLERAGWTNYRLGLAKRHKTIRPCSNANRAGRCSVRP